MSHKVYEMCISSDSPQYYQEILLQSRYLLSCCLGGLVL